MKRGNLLYSIISLVISVALCGGVLIAWFSNNRDVDAGGLDIDINSGNLAEIDGIVVSKYVRSQAGNGWEWQPVITYSDPVGQSDMSVGTVDAILEGDVFRFEVSLVRTENAVIGGVNKPLDVAAAFGGVRTEGDPVLSFPEGTAEQDKQIALETYRGYFRQFFLIGNTFRTDGAAVDEGDISTDRTDVSAPFNASRSLYNGGNGSSVPLFRTDENSVWTEDGYTFSFYILFHNVTTESGWDDVIPTSLFKYCSVAIDSFSVSVSESEGGAA